MDILQRNVRLLTECFDHRRKTWKDASDWPVLLISRGPMPIWHSIPIQLRDIISSFKLLLGVSDGLSCLDFSCSSSRMIMSGGSTHISTCGWAHIPYIYIFHNHPRLPLQRTNPECWVLSPNRLIIIQISANPDNQLDDLLVMSKYSILIQTKPASNVWTSVLRTSHHS